MWVGNSGISVNICLIFAIFTSLWPITSRHDLLTPSIAILISYFFASLGVKYFVSKKLFSEKIFFFFSENILFLSDPTKSKFIPRSVNLWSALSALKVNLYSALEVNIRYGSVTPLVIRSSTITPM